MRTLLYCSHSWRFNNWAGLVTAGVWVWPMTCPPLDSATFPYNKLGAADLVYIALHGFVDEPKMLFGDERNKAMGDYRHIPALAASEVRMVEMRPGAVVFLEGCNGMLTEFPWAFREAGAAAVVASKQATQDMTLTLGPAGMFGREFVKQLKRGVAVGSALVLAQAFSGVKTFKLVGNQAATLTPALSPWERV